MAETGFNDQMWSGRRALRIGHERSAARECCAHNDQSGGPTKHDFLPRCEISDRITLIQPCAGIQQATGLSYIVD
jgi:hypothetical protein